MFCQNEPACFFLLRLNQPSPPSTKVSKFPTFPNMTASNVSNRYFLTLAAILCTFLSVNGDCSESFVFPTRATGTFECFGDTGGSILEVTRNSIVHKLNDDSNIPGFERIELHFYNNYRLGPTRWEQAVIHVNDKEYSASSDQFFEYFQKLTAIVGQFKDKRCPVGGRGSHPRLDGVRDAMFAIEGMYGFFDCGHPSVFYTPSSGMF